MSVTVNARVGPSGKTICILFLDGSGVPTNVSALDPAHAPSIRVDGGASIPLANPLWGQDGGDPTPDPYLPFVVYPLGITITAGSTVTIDAPSGWATTVAGAAPVLGGAAVANLSGGTLLPALDPGPKSMRLGWNITYAAYFKPTNVYGNIARQSAGLGPRDDHGYPIGPFPASATLVSQPALDPTDPLGYPSAPADGVWTVLWDGAYAADIQLAVGKGTTATKLSDVPAANNVGHMRTYRVTVNTAVAHAPIVSYRFGAAGATNVRVYPPGEPTDGSSTFGTNLMRQAAGAQVMRYMNAQRIVASSVVDFEDFGRVDQLSAFSGPTGGAAQGVAVVSVGPYTRTDNWFDPANCAFTIIYAAPHGAKTGQVLTFGGPAAGPNADKSFPTTGGGTMAALFQAPVVVRVIDATTLAAEKVVKSGGGGTLTGTTTFAAGVTLNDTLYRDMPPADCVAMSNALGADCWLNIPHAASDACITALAQYVAANLNAGLKWYCEYSNEPWNTDPAYKQLMYWSEVGRTMPGSGATATATVNGSGVVTGLTLTNAGSGYIAAPVVTFSSGAARGHCTLIDGVLAIVLDAGGSGYSQASPPTVTISPALGNFPVYVIRAAHAHALCKAVFDAAGRSADLVRVMGGQYHNPGGPTDQIGTVCQRNGISFDALAVAPYFTNDLNGPSEPNMGTAYDLFDVDMLHDLSQLSLLYGPFLGLFAQHRASLDAAGFTGVPIVCYEGGMQVGAALGTVNTLQRSQQWARHPRMRELALYFFRRCQDGGCTLFAYFLLNDAITAKTNWATYFAREQLPGKGDGSDGRHDNRADYFDKSKVVSVIGQAATEWLGLARQAQPTDPGQAGYRPRNMTGRFRALRSAP